MLFECQRIAVGTSSFCKVSCWDNLPNQEMLSAHGSFLIRDVLYGLPSGSEQSLNCSLFVNASGCHSGTKARIWSRVPAGRRFTPHADFLYSPYSRENALGRPFSGVVATCPESRTGYHPFPQVDGFTPHTGGIYSPSLATTLVATFWLPTGYHPKTGFRGVNPYVAARANTCWTREHRLEMWELLSGSDGKAHFPS